MTWSPIDWTQTIEGPPLEALTHHLAECPADFLGEPVRTDGQGDVHVAAVVSDLLAALGGRLLTADEAAHLGAVAVGDKKGRNRLRCALVAAWTFAWFQRNPHLAADRNAIIEQARGFLLEGIDDFAPHVNASQLVDDPDRREETARTVLRAVGLRPLGESVAVAQDRLSTMSSAERQRVIRESRAAEERIRQIIEERRRQAEAEAASPWGRE